jgi:threonine aldolase
MDWIELRSDTRTVPTLEMRKAILTSTYGDWTYNED